MLIGDQSVPDSAKTRQISFYNTCKESFDDSLDSYMKMKLFTFFKKKGKTVQSFTQEEVFSKDIAGESQYYNENESVVPDELMPQEELDEPELEYEELEDYDPTKELSEYAFPTIDLLENIEIVFSSEEVIETKEKLINVLQTYNINIPSLETTIGYTNTLYEFVPQKGLRMNQVKNLKDELSFSFGTPNISIESLVERGSMGFVIPNKKQTILPIRSIVGAEEFINTGYELPLIIGQTLAHKNIIIDLTEKPHILISGATGQGKSVLINVIIASLLYKKYPSELKFALFDPIRIELGPYSILEKFFLAKSPGVKTNVVSDIQDAMETLRALTSEMDIRLEMLAKANVRNIKEYNTKFRRRELELSEGHRFMPYIVAIMDKCFDWIMDAGEVYIRRIVNITHLVGIHLILSIQRPSHDVIPTDIKNSFPVRIAFRTASRRDSQIILDEDGAEKLSGNGDAIYKDGSSKIRVQVPFISTDEVKNITRYIQKQAGYANAYLLPYHIPLPECSLRDLGDRDPLFDEAARLIVLHQQGSTSLIQRKFSIGYNRAGRLMDQLEAAGIVGPVQGGAHRKVYIADEYSLEKLLDSL